MQVHWFCNFTFLFLLLCFAQKRFKKCGAIAERPFVRLYINFMYSWTSKKRRWWIHFLCVCFVNDGTKRYCIRLKLQNEGKKERKRQNENIWFVQLTKHIELFLWKENVSEVKRKGSDSGCFVNIFIYKQSIIFSLF